jgi:UDP-glucose 4-epimerase
MNYLVTGSCGFIGSNLVDMLVSQGHNVIGIDNLSSDAHDKFYYNDKATYYEHNITDYVICSDVFNRHNPDIVFHLAAESRIQNCMIDPGKCMDTNVLGTETMLALAKKYSTKRLVFMSTSAIYGLSSESIFDVGYASQTETDRDDCLNPYSLSKLFGERLCKMYSNLYGLDTVCFRGFNIYGDRMPNKGQYALVLGIFQRLINEGKSLTIVGDGNQRRDFIHVLDVCRGLIAGANALHPQKGEVYNLGSGKNYSVNEIANILATARNHKLPHTHVPPRNGEAKITLANLDKIKKELSWYPQTSFEDWINTIKGY